jgi:hypothetical protein
VVAARVPLVVTTPLDDTKTCVDAGGVAVST